jgi:hypothetical protein
MTTATTIPTTDERIASRRAELTKQRAERVDDYPLSWTQKQANAYVAETATLDKKIAAFNAAVETWAALPTLDADTKWLAHLKTWRDTISDERLAIKSPIRDKATRERAQSLEWSIKLIDHGWAANRLPSKIVTLASTRLGELMAAANYDVAGEGLYGPRGFRGSLPDTEQRVKTLTRQRAEAQAALDLALEDDTDRAKRAAESQAHRDALNSMEIRGGDSLRAYHKDTGEPLDVADMTEEQRAAFERFEAAEREYRQGVIDRQMGRG